MRSELLRALTCSSTAAVAASRSALASCRARFCCSARSARSARISASRSRRACATSCWRALRSASRFTRSRAARSRSRCSMASRFKRCFRCTSRRASAAASSALRRSASSFACLAAMSARILERSDSGRAGTFIGLAARFGGFLRPFFCCLVPDEPASFMLATASSKPRLSSTARFWLIVASRCASYADIGGVFAALVAGIGMAGAVLSRRKTCDAKAARIDGANRQRV